MAERYLHDLKLALDLVIIRILLQAQLEVLDFRILSPTHQHKRPFSSLQNRETHLVPPLPLPLLRPPPIARSSLRSRALLRLQRAREPLRLGLELGYLGGERSDAVGGVGACAEGLDFGAEDFLWGEG